MTVWYCTTVLSVSYWQRNQFGDEVKTCQAQISFVYILPVFLFLAVAITCTLYTKQIVISKYFCTLTLYHTKFRLQIPLTKKALVTSIFSFSNNVFYSSQQNFQYLSQNFFCRLQVISIWTSLENMSFGKELNSNTFNACHGIVATIFPFIKRRRKRIFFILRLLNMTYQLLKIK